MSITSALHKVAGKVTKALDGVSVTFTKVGQGSYNAATDTATPTPATVVGSAVRIDGDPEQYAQLGLLESNPVTLQFTPNTLGQKPALGATCTWEGRKCSVRAVDPTAPSGSTITCTVVIA